MNVTQTVSINGWARLRDVLVAAFPAFNGMYAKELTVVNNNAGVAYLHFTDSGAQPATASDGLPLSNVSTDAPGMAFTAEGVDLASAWINTPGAQNITIAVNGGA